MIERIKVHVELENEGTSVLRPTSAFKIGDGVYVLSNENYDATTEDWIVAPGSLITVSERSTSEGNVLVAAEYEDLRG